MSQNDNSNSPSNTVQRDQQQAQAYITAAKNPKNYKQQDNKNQNSQSPTKKGQEKQKKGGGEDQWILENFSRGRQYFGCKFNQTHNQNIKIQDQNCYLCRLYVEDPSKFESKQQRNISLYISQNPMSFSQFMLYLLPPSNELEGCELLFADSVFFNKEDGSIEFMAKTKQGKLVGTYQPGRGPSQIKNNTQPQVPQKNSTLTITEISKKFPDTVRQRNKLTSGIFKNQAMMYSLNNKPPDDKDITSPNSHKEQSSSANKKTSSIKIGKKQKGKKNGDQSSSPKALTQSGSQAINLMGQVSNETIIVRFRQQDVQDNDKHIQDVIVLDPIRTTKFFSSDIKKDKLDKRIEVIQTCIKAKRACGEAVIYQFYAPLNESDPQKEINYDYKSLPTDWELIQQGQDQAFAHRQCLKCCYYIQKVKAIEVLQFKAEFLKDDHGDIWFYYAHNIHSRNMQQDKPMSHLRAVHDAKELGEKKQLAKQKIVSELQVYEKHQKDQGQQSKVVLEMVNQMNSYFENLKTEVGINVASVVDEEDNELDSILKTLRPNTSAKNFKEFLKLEDNCLKSQNWRKISRKLVEDEKKEQLAIEQDRLGPGVLNLYGHEEPRSLKVQQLVDAFRNSYRRPGQPILVETSQQKLLNRISTSAKPGLMNRLPIGDQNEHQFTDFKMNNVDPKHVKAELIRRNLITRKDLMQLYRPPVKITANTNFMAF